jgi:hypothetical protein
MFSSFGFTKDFLSLYMYMQACRNPCPKTTWDKKFVVHAFLLESLTLVVLENRTNEEVLHATIS